MPLRAKLTLHNCATSLCWQDPHLARRASRCPCSFAETRGRVAHPPIRRGRPTRAAVKLQDSSSQTSPDLRRRGEETCYSSAHPSRCLLICSPQAQTENTDKPPTTTRTKRSPFARVGSHENAVPYPARNLQANWRSPRHERVQPPPGCGPAVVLRRAAHPEAWQRHVDACSGKHPSGVQGRRSSARPTHVSEGRPLAVYANNPHQRGVATLGPGAAGHNARTATPSGHRAGAWPARSNGTPTPQRRQHAAPSAS